MSKKEIVTAWWVEVEVEVPFLAHRVGFEDCEKMAASIRRHVDHVRSVSVRHETSATCEFCGYAWTEKDANYNGGCCEKDEANNPENVLAGRGAKEPQ